MGEKIFEYLILFLMVFTTNGIGIYLIKSMIEELKADNEKFADKFDIEIALRNKCQKELPILYASATQTQVKFDNHEVRISSLERDVFNIKDKCSDLKNIDRNTYM